MARKSRPFWRRQSRFRYFLEYLPLRLVVQMTRMLPLDTGSDILAAIGRTVGPLLPIRHRIRRNLKLVWPNISEAGIEQITRGVWDNFSRIPHEYSNLDRFHADQGNRIEIVGAEHLVALRESGRPAILFSAHIGEWEMVALAAQRHGITMTMIYRTFNNPYFDDYIQEMKRRCGLELVGKGREAARRLTEVLKGNGYALMLVDVRMSDGIPVPFMGVPAMTPAAPAALALRHDALIMPVHVERTEGAHFRVIFEEARPPVDTGDRNADIEATMRWVNGRIESWIRERPEQWMWLHTRWGKNPKPRS